MLPEIRRILYAIDLSKNSAFAFRYALKLAEPSRAEIILLHVMEELSPTAMALVGSYIVEERKEAFDQKQTAYYEEAIKKRLTAFSQKELKSTSELDEKGVTIKLVSGYPAEEILKQADKLNCDAIVMGTHSKGFLQQTFLGSIAKRVLRRVRKPVFIIPLPEEEIDITFHEQ